MASAIQRVASTITRTPSVLINNAAAAAVGHHGTRFTAATLRPAIYAPSLPAHAHAPLSATSICPAWRSPIVATHHVAPISAPSFPILRVHGTSWRGESSDRAPLISSTCTSISSSSASFAFSSTIPALPSASSSLIQTTSAPISVPVLATCVRHRIVPWTPIIRSHGLHMNHTGIPHRSNRYKQRNEYRGDSNHNNKSDSQRNDQSSSSKNRRRIGGRLALTATLGIWSIDSGAPVEDFAMYGGPPSPIMPSHHRQPANTGPRRSTHHYHRRRHSDDDTEPLSYSPPSLFAASNAPVRRTHHAATSGMATSSTHASSSLRLSTSPPNGSSSSTSKHINGAQMHSPLYGATQSPSDTSASPLRLLLDHLQQRNTGRRMSHGSNSSGSGDEANGNGNNPSPPRHVTHVPRPVRVASAATTSPSWLSLGTAAWNQSSNGAPQTNNNTNTNNCDSPNIPSHNANLHMAPAFVLSSASSSSAAAASSISSTIRSSPPPVPSGSPPITAPAFVYDINDMKRNVSRPLGRSHSGSMSNNPTSVIQPTPIPVTSVLPSSSSVPTSSSSMIADSLRHAKHSSIDTNSTKSNDISLGGHMSAQEAERRARADPAMAAAFDAFRAKVHVDDDGKLSLSKHDLCMPDRWRALGYFLMASPNVRSLRLDGMEICEEEAAMLGKGVLRQIKHIQFCGNNIGLTEGSMEIIVGVLLLCEYLESAAFQRNSLDDEAMPHIARLISDHNTLSSLDISLNGIADAGARHIALAISNLKYSFAKINLSFNFIGAAGREKLLAAQTAHRQATGRLVAVELTGNDPIAAFLQAKAERDSLRESIISSASSTSSSSVGQSALVAAMNSSNNSSNSSHSSNGSNSGTHQVTALIPTGTPPLKPLSSPTSLSAASAAAAAANLTPLAIGSPQPAGMAMTSSVAMPPLSPQQPLAPSMMRQDPPAALRGGLLGGTLGPFGALRAHRAPLRHTTTGSAGSPLMIPRSGPLPIPSASSSISAMSPSLSSCQSSSLSIGGVGVASPIITRS